MDEIIIKSTLNGCKITGAITPPKKYMKYFKSTKLFAYYDAPIHSDPSITNIPLLATILPLAWITGLNVHLDSLDLRFKESMEHLQQDFKRAYPLGPFTTEIKADTLKENITLKSSEKQTALLFSGGVDSTYSLVKNLEQKPRLLMIWGVDNFAYPENKTQWDYIYRVYSEQAKKLELPINLIQTNISQILDIKRINHTYHKLLYNGSFRALIQHSLILLPLMAPLSIGRFNKLMIASSASQTRDYRKLPWGSSPSIDEQIIWADLEVKHDGALERAEKIGLIKPYLIKNKLLLRVCLNKLDRAELNDGSCEKCVRTLLTLLLSEINPNTCGFKVDGTTFEKMKEVLSLPIDRTTVNISLAPIQRKIPPNYESKIPEVTEFFHWYKEHEFKTRGDYHTHRRIYYSLPYHIAQFLDALYRKNGIHIHEQTTERTEKSHKRELHF